MRRRRARKGVRHSGGRCRVNFVGTAAVAAHLHDSFGAVFVNSISQFFQIWNIFIFIYEDASGLADLPAAGAFDNQQAGAAFGAFGVISALALRD